MEFTPQSTRKTLDLAGEMVGVATEDAHLLRMGENALFHLSADGIVVRIARTMDYWEDVVREVAVSKWLHDVGLPAAEVVEEIEQPQVVQGHPVTFWHYIDGTPAPYSRIGDLGSRLRVLHRLEPPPELALPEQNILDRVQPRVERANIPESDQNFLLERLDMLREEVDNLSYDLPSCAVHGDAHIKNLMVRGGEAVLIDFERFAYGQPEWDLGVTATEYCSAGWWTSEQYKQFADAYGFDVTSWSGFSTVQAVHQLKMTTWLMQNIQESQDVANEFNARMMTIRDGLNAKWSPW